MYFRYLCIYLQAEKLTYKNWNLKDKLKIVEYLKSLIIMCIKQQVFRFLYITDQHFRKAINSANTIKNSNLNETVIYY